VCYASEGMSRPLLKLVKRSLPLWGTELMLLRQEFICSRRLIPLP
jgi:hypothetical protein